MKNCLVSFLEYSGDKLTAAVIGLSAMCVESGIKNYVLEQEQSFGAILGFCYNCIC
jgi:hypothetical protein